MSAPALRPCLALLFAFTVLAHPMSAQVVINEVDYDQSGSDAAEYVEFYNAGVGSVDLSTYSVVFVNGSNGSTYDTINLPAVSLPAGGFFVVCANAATVANCDLDDGPDTNFIQNGSPDAIALYDGVTLVDVLSYEGSTTGFTEGTGAGADNPGTDFAGLSRHPDGADTDDNSADFFFRCISPGEANLATSSSCEEPFIPPAVVINEIDSDTPGTDVAEFVELFGPAGAPLDGLVLVFFNGSNDESYEFYDLDGFSLDAGGFFVLCVDAANVANCDLDDPAAADNLIQNGADAVALYVGDGSDFPNGTAVTTDGLLDALVYDTNDGDDAGLLPLLNPGQAQINEDGGGDKDNHSNSRVPDGGTGRDTDTYVQQSPTPGASNITDPPSSDVVINEIDADTPGTDAAEFIELFGPANEPLDGLVLVLFNGNGDVAYEAYDLDGHALDANGFFVACANNATVANCNLDLPGNATNLIQNGADAAALYIADAADFGDGTSPTTLNLIDAIVYDTDDGDDAGLLILLNAGQPQVNEAGGGDKDNHSNSRVPDGGVGRDTDTYVQQTPTPGASNVPLPPIVINEVDADQTSTDSAEFVELFGPPNTALDGLVLVFYNGSDDASYEAFDLDGFSIDPTGFFVACANAATVANCDFDLPGNATNLLQNGADAVALHIGDGSDYPNDTPVSTVNLVDAVVYDTDDGDDAGLLVLLNPGQPQVNEDGNNAATTESNSRVPDGGIARDTDTYVQQAPTPGETNRPLEIFEIQGSGLSSPFADAFVTTKANIVTAVGPEGFAIQTPDARADGNQDTSDGIYVFTGGAPGVSVGDAVDVTGQVVEFFDLTEFAAGTVVTVNSGGNPLPAAIPFDGNTPSTNPASPSCSIEFECYEGMLVTVTGGSVGSGNQSFGTDPIAESFIAAGPDRAFREPGIAFPGMAGLPVWDGNPEVFELDPDKLGLANIEIPGGSTFDATGIIGYEFGGYELWPTTLTPNLASLPAPVRARVAGEATIGSLNLFRLFDDFDDLSDVNPDGETRNDEVVTTQEYDTHREKLARYIVEVLDAPDILAVQEAEKLDVLQALAVEIATIDASVSYASYLIEGNDVGTIDVGFMVRSTVQVDSVIQLGALETYINPINSQPEILHDRPPLLLVGDFLTPSGDTPIAVLGVHNRSFSGIDSPSQGERVRFKRFSQAQSIAQMVQDWQTANPDVGLAVVGDFNDYEFSDGYVDAVGRIAGDFVDADDLIAEPADLVSPDLTIQTFGIPATERYSFIFDGSAQALDHALTSIALDPKVSGFEFGRGNADAPEVLFDDAATPLASSDHDGFALFMDVTPPALVLADPASHWPPNNKFESYATADIVASLSDGLTAADVWITAVTSDEPVVDPNDPDADPDDPKVDIIVDDCQNVQLKRRRHGSDGANGRVYTVHVAVTDSAGNIATAAYQISVPINKDTPAIDDGAAYTVDTGCTGLAAPTAPIASTEDRETLGKTERLPTEFSLSANYPNPFNPQTAIEFALPSAVEVSLRIFDTAGREVARLIDGSLPAGTHRAIFDARDLPSGVYVYSIRAGAFVEHKTMVLLR